MLPLSTVRQTPTTTATLPNLLVSTGMIFSLVHSALMVASALAVSNARTAQANGMFPRETASNPSALLDPLASLALPAADPPFHVEKIRRVCPLLACKSLLTTTRTLSATTTCQTTRFANRLPIVPRVDLPSRTISVVVPNQSHLFFLPLLLHKAAL